MIWRDPSRHHIITVACWRVGQVSGAFHVLMVTAGDCWRPLTHQEIVAYDNRGFYRRSFLLARSMSSIKTKTPFFKCLIEDMYKDGNSRVKWNKIKFLKSSCYKWQVLTVFKNSTGWWLQHCTLQYSSIISTLSVAQTPCVTGDTDWLKGNVTQRNSNN